MLPGLAWESRTHNINIITLLYIRSASEDTHRAMSDYCAEASGTTSTHILTQAILSSARQLLGRCEIRWHTIGSAVC